MSSRPSHGPEHVHPDQWSRIEQHRYEDRMYQEINGLKEAVESLTVRVTLMLGGLTLVAVLLPIIAPFMRALLNIDPPPGQ